MKRVVNGKAYNTRTAELIAETDDEFEKRNESWLWRSDLYRTPKGSWFVVENEWPAVENEHEDRSTCVFRVLSLDKALQWVANPGNVTLHKEDYFPTQTHDSVPLRSATRRNAPQRGATMSLPSRNASPRDATHRNAAQRNATQRRLIIDSGSDL